MQLIVSKLAVDLPFVNFLIEKIQEYFINHLDGRQIARWDKYLKENVATFSKIKSQVSARDILVSGISNLIVLQTDSSYIITVDPNNVLYGTNLKVSSLCKLINNGNLSISGYPVFTRTFEMFKLNIRLVYNEYSFHSGEYLNGGLFI